MKILLSKRAELSFEEIVAYYVSVHSAKRAQKVIQSIENAFTAIAADSLAYPVCFDLTIPRQDVRQIIVHNTFKVIYRVELKQIIIIEIFHGRRDPGILKDLK